MSSEILSSNEISLGRLVCALEEVGLKKWGRNKKIAEITGYSQTGVSEIMSGNNPVTSRFLKAICSYYGISEHWVLTGETKKAGTVFFADPSEAKFIAVREMSAKGVKRTPVLGTVPAGFPQPTAPVVQEDIIDYVYRSDLPDDAFALRVVGDSMPPLETGDYVAFIVDGNYNDRDLIVARNEFGDPIVKRLRIRPDGSKVLTSDNPNYKPLEPNEHYQIIGKVIKAWRELI